MDRPQSGKFYRLYQGYRVCPSFSRLLLLNRVQSREMLFALAAAYGLTNGSLLSSLQALTLGAVKPDDRTEATAS
jgi:hypothetical protein